jgi:NAD(P)-dependent dehydrogenase (short-subunit alcohol dehydrogenase family)
MALAQDGWRVGLLGRRAEPLTQLQAVLPRPDEHPVLLADVGDAAAVARAFAELVERAGRLDLLFNNAGTFTPATALEDLALEDWEAALRTNLTGAFLCMQQAVRQMKHQSPRGGRIINNGSISARVPRPLSAAYTATKFALTGLTRSLALDGRVHGIACGQIDIGNAATDMTQAMAEGVLQADGSRRAEARMDVAHVARAVVYMARLPLEANVLDMSLMATGMPFVGRG